MDLGLSGSTLTWIVVALIVAGLAMGFLAGLFGIGGGGIVAPVLYEFFGTLGVPETHRMHLAVGTALAVMIPTTLRAFMAHRARGGVDEQALRRLAPAVVVGVVLGAVVARYAPGILLRWMWVGFAALMITKLLLGKASWQLGTDLPEGWIVEAYGVITGLLSMLLSIGGGAFITTMLTLYGRPIQKAVGTSTGVAPLVAIPGALGFIWAGWHATDLAPFSIGYVNLLGFALLVPSSVFAAPFGVALSHIMPRRMLEVLFAGLLAIVGGRMLLSLVM